jgi:hypothetical protein
MRPLNPKFRFNSRRHIVADILAAMYSQSLNIFFESGYKAKGNISVKLDAIVVE